MAECDKPRRGADDPAGDDRGGRRPHKRGDISFSSFRLGRPLSRGFWLDADQRTLGTAAYKCRSADRQTWSDRRWAAPCFNGVSDPQTLRLGVSLVERGSVATPGDPSHQQIFPEIKIDSVADEVSLAPS